MIRLKGKKEKEELVWERATSFAATWLRPYKAIPQSTTLGIRFTLDDRLCVGLARKNSAEYWEIFILGGVTHDNLRERGLPGFYIARRPYTSELGGAPVLAQFSADYGRLGSRTLQRAGITKLEFRVPSGFKEKHIRKKKVR